ncbi:MAG TPA: hypothetical protein VIC54_14485 [Terriglobales bacterium]|jgi:hypothetical protein
MITGLVDLSRSPRLEWGLAGAGLAVAAAVVVGLVRRWRRPSAEAVERARRLLLHRIGRITGGEILDAFPPPPSTSSLEDAPRPPTLVYRYQVSGVVYEASQALHLVDTALDPDSWIPGWPVQVKFDPAHPGNSIIACESWSGLTVSARARAASTVDG